MFSRHDLDVVLCLTSVDYELFMKHYDVYNIEYMGGYKFKSTTGLFKDYIDKWNDIKMEATLTNNTAMRTIAKLMMNSLYGKFSLNPIVQSKYPVWDGKKITYKISEKERRKPIYIPVGSFITSWARYITITSAQLVKDRFLYADTDSLHLLGTELPPQLKIDDVRLGWWKHEGKFKRGKYLRQKSYIEDMYDYDKKTKQWLETTKLHITCSGMPDACYPYVTWDNFKIGSRFKGKLEHKHVIGGIVLEEIDFTLNL